MVSILGQHISLIRPERPYKCIGLTKKERPVPRKSRRKTIQEHTGKVCAVCVQTKSGHVYHYPRGMHIDVLEAFNLAADCIAKTGWLLEGRKYVWR